MKIFKTICREQLKQSQEKFYKTSQNEKSKCVQTFKNRTFKVSKYFSKNIKVFPVLLSPSSLHTQDNLKKTQTVSC